MTTRILFPILAVILTAVSCGKQSSGGQHATVVMRDGTKMSGTVLSSSVNEIRLAGDDRVERTIPAPQIRSIEYDETPPASNPPQPGTAFLPSGQGHSDHYHPSEDAVTTTTHQLPVGTEISVRNEETIDSGKAVENQTFPAEVTKDVRDADGNVVIPRGSNAQIIIRSASKGRKIRGASDLVMDLASVSIDGRLYEISTEDIAKRGQSGVGANRRTGEFTGGGAAIGAIIGAIAGGGKGAAIGAGAGAGAGAVTQIVTKGTIKVPVESVLTFKLDAPLLVAAAR